MIKDLLASNKILVVRCSPIDQEYVSQQIMTHLINSCEWRLSDRFNTENTLPLGILSEPLKCLINGDSKQDQVMVNWLTAASSLPMFEQSYLLDMISGYSLSGSTAKIIFLQTDDLLLPESLTHIAAEYYWPLPSHQEIRALCQELSIETTDKLIATCTGLAYEDLRKGLQQSINTPDMLKSLSSYRDRRFALRGIAIAPKPEFTEIAGLDLLQKELTDVAFCFSAAGQALGLPFPKGWFLVGPPGVGKTHTALVTGFILGFPIISLNADVIIIGGIAGLKKILQTAEAVSPCVLLIDEIEKCFGSAKDEQLFGYLLTFMNDNKLPIFVFGTLNRPEQLRIEMTRAGRIDEVWSVTFPDELDRKEAFKIFLKKYDDRFSNGDEVFSLPQWTLISGATRRFAPAEIKRVVEKAICSVKRNNPDAFITAEDLAETAEAYFTMFKRDEKTMLDLQNSADGKARPAQSPGRKLASYNEYNPHAPIVRALVTH